MSAETEPQTAAPSTVKPTGRRRRPTGARPPLPRQPGLLRQELAGRRRVAAGLGRHRPQQRVGEPGQRAADATILRQVARLRTDWLSDVMRAIDRVSSGWIMSAIGIGLLVALDRSPPVAPPLHLLPRARRGRGDRWAHLRAVRPTTPVRRHDHRPLGGVLHAGGAGRRHRAVRHRPRLSLVPAGRSREIAKAVSGVAVAVFTFPAMYLAKFHPSDIVVGVGISTAVLITLPGGRSSRSAASSRRSSPPTAPGSPRSSCPSATRPTSRTSPTRSATR